MSDHTPGPWTWWTSNSWRRLKHDNRGKTLNVLEPTVCHDGQPDCIISQDDMALIAASPDLLAALLNVRKLISEAALTGFNCKDGDWADRLFFSQQMSSAAIKKATRSGDQKGEQSNGLKEIS